MSGAPIANVDVRTLVIPTEEPESDGTLEWDHTTVVIVEVEAGGRRGLGWTYADRASAELAARVLGPRVRGLDAFAVGAAWDAMARALRNLGRPGAGMMALSAIDVALWDLKARLLDVPLAQLLPSARERVPVYGSGGFTSYSEERLCAQLAGWVAAGIPRVKMKIGRDAAADVARVAAARRAVGDEAELYVDANGAYTPTLALEQARQFAAARVRWLEEPVSSDDLDGLAWLRARAPAGMAVAAGEYGSDPWYFQRMLAARAVDVLQIDATRAGGVTGFLRAAALADAFQVPVSAHCVPSLHAHVACAAPRLAHLEWFHDHVRIERLIFDGTLTPERGCVAPDRTRAGLGLELKRSEAARHAA